MFNRIRNRARSFMINFVTGYAVGHGLGVEAKARGLERARIAQAARFMAGQPLLTKAEIRAMVKEEIQRAASENGL